MLQDLTFVHIGNSDLLPDGNINFSKRWQQFNIVENMKRFKKGYVNVHINFFFLTIHINTVFVKKNRKIEKISNSFNYTV